MDFLLECIGFGPDQNPEELLKLLDRFGEPMPWSGTPDRHRLIPLGNGLEVRAERLASGTWTFSPAFRTSRRLRVAVTRTTRLADSAYEAQLLGWAAPPARGMSNGDPRGAYMLAMYLNDARKLPKRVPTGHVLAVEMAGFAVDVDYVGPNESSNYPSIHEAPAGALLRPLGGADDPGGCMEVSLRVRNLRHLRNPVTGRDVDLITFDAPERPISAFLSPWQLEAQGLEAPRPGSRVEGVFLFTGRIAGGLPGPRATVRGNFG